MRSTFVFVAGISLFACGGMDAGNGADDILDPNPAIEIRSTDITVQPGEEFTKCFYWTMPNTTKVAVHKWVSDLSPGSHHMIMFRTLTGQQPADGTIDDCSGGTAIPVYGTQVQHEELAMPDDDGFGKPVAQEVQPGTQGYFQMHYFNSSDAAITAHVEVKAYGLIASLAEHVGNYTKTDVFGTYNNDIRIPPHANNLTISATCPTIPEVNFWQMSTHSHKQTVMADVKEASAMVLQSPDWEHPTAVRWDAPTFYKFGTGTLTWECTYSNLADNQNRTITAGESAKTDEMCMAIGYYFPASGPKGCVMDQGQCQCFL